MLASGSSITTPGIVAQLEVELVRAAEAGLFAEQVTCADAAGVARHLVGQYGGDVTRLALALALPILPLYDMSIVRARSPDAAAVCPLPPAVSGSAQDT